MVKKCDWKNCKENAVMNLVVNGEDKNYCGKHSHDIIEGPY